MKNTETRANFLFIAVVAIMAILAGQITLSIQIKQAFEAMTTNHETIYEAGDWFVLGKEPVK